MTEPRMRVGWDEPTELTIGRARRHARIDGAPWAVLAPASGRAFEAEARPEWRAGDWVTIGSRTGAVAARVLYRAEPPAA